MAYNRETLTRHRVGANPTTSTMNKELQKLVEALETGYYDPNNSPIEVIDIDSILTDEIMAEVFEVFKTAFGKGE
jgi:hypothetical protein